MNNIYSFYFGVLVYSLGMGTYFSFGVGLINFGLIVIVAESGRSLLSYLNRENNKPIKLTNNQERWTE